MVTLELTSQQFYALHLILLDRLRDVRKSDSDATGEWNDVLTDSVVTIEDLICLFSEKIRNAPVPD